MRKITFKQAFLKKNPKYKRVLLYLDESLGKEFTWKDFTKLNLIDLRDYLTDKLAQSSQRTYFAMIKSILNDYCEEIEIPCKSYNEILTIKNVKSSNTWLTEEELERLIAYVPESPLEQQVRNQFIIGAYTGCRHSDFLKLDKTNIVNNSLVYVSQKTKIQATVPLKPIVQEYLAFEKKGYSDVTFNRTIRHICQKCKINDNVKLFQAGKEESGEKWEFVTSHTARRSFATNLYLRECDLYSISQMMGHSSIEMTERYICCGLKKQSSQVMGYFK